MPTPRTLIPLRVGAVILALLGIFPLAAVIKYAPIVSWLPTAAREWAISTSLLIVICLVTAHVLADRADSLLDRGRTLLLAPVPRVFAGWAAFATLAIALFFAWYVFGGVPIVGDEMAQRFQARLLARGRLWAVAESPHEFFNGIQTVTIDGRWFSQFPIGGPALLALGGLVGAPAVINPALAAWTSISLYWFAARTTDEATARTATLLFVLSPFVLMMSGSQMNHAGALALLTFALSELPVWARSDDPKRIRRSAFLIGLAVAAMAAIRPYDAAICALAIGGFQLFVSWRTPTRQRTFVWQMLGGALPLAMLLVANWQTTGTPLLFGYDAANGPSHRPGFHVDPSGNQFTPVQGIHHISTYLLLLNSSLFAGPIPAVLLIVTALALTRRVTGWDYLLLALIGVLLVGYGAYWAESLFVGPRFLYVGVPAFVLIAAKLPEALSSRMERPLLRRAALFLLPFAIAIAWLLPAEAFRHQGVWSAAASVRSSRMRQNADVGSEIAAAGLTNALVFVHDSWHGRLAARLRAIGAPALTAEAMVAELDACALQTGLDIEAEFEGPPSKDRVTRVARRGLMAGPVTPVRGLDAPNVIALSGPPTPACASELESDRGGTRSLEVFLPHQGFAEDGRPGGNVVFVRDLGWRNHLLLSRFGDRTWYRYRRSRGSDDSAPAFVPYFGPR